MQRGQDARNTDSYLVLVLLQGEGGLAIRAALRTSVVCPSCLLDLSPQLFVSHSSSVVIHYAGIRTIARTAREANGSEREPCRGWDSAPKLCEQLLMYSTAQFRVFFFFFLTNKVIPKKKKKKKLGYIVVTLLIPVAEISFLTLLFSAACILFWLLWDAT